MGVFLSMIKNYILKIDLAFLTLLCLLGGMLDAYTFLHKDGTFTLIQTGNLIRSIIYFVTQNYYNGAYSLILFLAFFIFIFIYYFLIKYLKQKNLSNKVFALSLGIFLLIPDIVFEFNKVNYLDAKNLFSGLCSTMFGAMLATSFRKVYLKNNLVISFNPAMMTGNTRSLIFSLVNAIKYKNNQKYFEALSYFIILISFSVGLSSIALNYFYLTDIILQKVINVILIYVTIITLIILGLIIEFKIAKHKRQQLNK